MWCLTEEDVSELRNARVSAWRRKPPSRSSRCALVDLIRRRFPQSEVRFVDTVCQPTKQRQHAAVELAQQATW